MRNINSVSYMNKNKKKQKDFDNIIDKLFDNNP